MAILLGMVGVLVGLIIFAAGFFICYKFFMPETAPEAVEEVPRFVDRTDEQKEQDSAWDELLGYNADAAYGISVGIDKKIQQG